MDEKHFAEIEKALLVISGARDRVRKAAKDLLADGAEPHLVESLEQADREIERAYKKLFQDTYFAVPEPQPKLFKQSGSPESLTPK